MLRRVIVQSPCFHAALCMHRRFAQPTFSEISEALAVLGVDIHSDPKEWKKCYRELVRKHHPDAGGDEATMSKITVAYERLTSLSKREVEEYQAQKSAYRGGNGSFGGSTSQAYRTYAGAARQGQAYGETMNNPNFHQWQQGPRSGYSTDYQRNKHKGTYDYNRGTGAFYQDPFRSNPFDFRRSVQSAARMPFRHLMIRGLVAYFAVSFLFVAAYRRAADWRHDDGWKASESLARHEQLEELHRIRRELNERIAGARDASNSLRGQDFERSRELRVAEYAQRRTLELNDAEFSSWPKFSEAKGKLVKRPADPPGVTYFDPGRANERKRQVATAFGETATERRQREEVSAKSTPTPPSDPSKQEAALKQANNAIQSILGHTSNSAAFAEARSPGGLVT